MDNSEKIDFLDYCKELARNLEEVTNEFIEVQIGWINNDAFHLIGMPMPVTIMLNNKTAWFGGFDDGEGDWNETVIYDKVKYFVPVKNPYLILNELIEKAYKNRG